MVSSLVRSRQWTLSSGVQPCGRAPDLGFFLSDLERLFGGWPLKHLSLTGDIYQKVLIVAATTSKKHSKGFSLVF